MPPRADGRLGTYLAPEETAKAVSSGRFSGAASWSDGRIAVTDRRLLCVDGEGNFLTIGFDEIGSIEGRPRTSTTVRGTDPRLLLAGGVLLASVGLLGVFRFSTGPSVLVLAAVTGVAIIAAISTWRTDGDPSWASMPTVTGGRTEHALEGQGGHRLAGVLPEWVRGAGPVALGSWGIAVVGTSVLLLSGAPLVLGVVLVTVGGVALVDFARRHQETLDGVGITRRRELELTLTTRDGRTIALRSQPAEAIHRELSKVTFAGDGAPAQVEIPTD